MTRSIHASHRRRTVHVAVVAAMAGLHIGSASAAEFIWTCDGTNDWANAACWDLPGGPPAAGDSAYLSYYGGVNDRTVTYSVAAPAAALNQLIIDATGTGSVTLQQTDGALAAGYEWVGYLGTGTHAQAGGTNTISGELILGLETGSAGTYALSGGALETATTYVGQGGNGSFVQSGGTHTISTAAGEGTLIVGANSGSNSAYELSGTGALQADKVRIGYLGTGSFVQNGGTVTVTELAEGYESFDNLPGGTPGGVGSYTLNGGTLTVNGAHYVGYWGQGSFVHNDGSHSATDLYVGRKRGVGSYELNGGTLAVSGIETLGLILGSDGTFVQNGGTHTIGTRLDIAPSAGAAGTFVLNGGSLTAPQVNVGDDGEFVYAGGTLAANVANTGMFTVEGAGIHGIDGSLTNTGRVTLADGSQLAVDANLTAGAGGAIHADLGSLFHAGTTPWITVGNHASLGGIFELGLDGSLALSDGASWTLLSASSLTGTFDTLFLPTVAGWTWDLNYDYGNAIVTLTAHVSAVPVPAAVWLLGSGLIGLATCGRRRNRTGQTS